MTAEAGLGIAAFLKHNSDAGGGGQWLRQWRKKGVGEVTIWLHTLAPIVPCFSHSFMFEDEYEDKQTGKTTPTLRYPRFVSPDAEIVHRNQYFRNDDGTMQVPPDLDPFLLLREWLRFGAEHLSLEEPIFKWHDAKERRDVVWERGELSGLVKRGQKNFGHSLDTKLEYIYVVVDNDAVSEGPVLAREGKLVSQKIGEVIKQQQKQWGDKQGDPLQHPYAFQLVGEDASSPMNAYKAFKAERAEFTEEVWAQISCEDFPDPLKHGQPVEGDMEKLRELFEQAAQVELPIDQIFSDDPAVRRDLTRNTGGNRPAPRASKASATKVAAPTQAQRPPVPQRGGKPAAAAAPQTNTGAPQVRRKKVDKPAEPPPPEVEVIPCADCGKDMLATDTKCSSCGAEYELIVDEAQAAVAVPTLPAANANGKPSTSTKPKSAAAPKPIPAASPSSRQPSLPHTDSAQKEVVANCWSCGALLNGKDNCPSCGIEQGDDLPFIFNECESQLSGIGERWNSKLTARQII
jgi:predicted RNA-binding Zn-ribbon protein involved in translation (DUF1610 family)